MKYINIQTERFKSYDRLNESEKACLLDSIVKYAREVRLPDEATPPIVDVIFAPIQEDMDYYNESYQAKVARAKVNGRMGGRPKGNRVETENNRVETEKNRVGYFRNREKPSGNREKAKINNNINNNINKEENNKEENNKEERYSDDDAMDTAIKRWFAYKKERKETYKPMGEKAFIAKLHNLSGGNGDIAIKIVQEAMANNYQGIFPLKGTNTNPDVGQILNDSRQKDYNKGGW